MGQLTSVLAFTGMATLAVGAAVVGVKSQTGLIAPSDVQYTASTVNRGEAYVDRGRVFAAYAADYFVRNPSDTSTVGWSTISSSAALPAALAATPMPTTWTARLSGGAVVVCVPDLDANSILQLSKVITSLTITFKKQTC